jgi:glucosamine--fructose-6-phosphate aminotransferase (isomerizing)
VQQGFVFESETDTETIPKLLKHLYDTHADNKLTFRELVELAIQQLVCCITGYA